MDRVKAVRAELKRIEKLGTITLYMLNKKLSLVHELAFLMGTINAEQREDMDNAAMAIVTRINETSKLPRAYRFKAHKIA